MYTNEYAQSEDRAPCSVTRLFRRHFSEQYLTSSQTFSHFLRHENGNPQVAHVLLGKSFFLRCFMGDASCLATGRRTATHNRQMQG